MEGSSSVEVDYASNLLNIPVLGETSSIEGMDC